MKCEAKFSKTSKTTAAWQVISLPTRVSLYRRLREFPSPCCSPTFSRLDPCTSSSFAEAALSGPTRSRGAFVASWSRAFRSEGSFVVERCLDRRSFRLRRRRASHVVVRRLPDRRSKEKSETSSFWTDLRRISFVLCLLELSHHPKGPNAEVADLVLEASGTKSIDRRGAFDIPQNKLLSEVMTEFLNKAKAYREKAHELEPGLQSLYAPESFSAPEAMSRTRDSVQKITALDHESALQLEQWPSRVQEQTARSPLSEADKQGFLQGFHDTFSNSEIVTLRRQGDQIEAQWCEDTLALYDFARSHARQIHVKDAHILIEDENVRTRFNDLLHQSREQRQRMTDTNAQLAKLQKWSPEVWPDKEGRRSRRAF